MNTRIIRSIKLLFTCCLITSCLAMTACSHWQESESLSGLRGRFYPRITGSDIRHFRESIRYQQGDAGDHYRLGRYFQNRGRHILAIEEFSRAVDLDPLRADAHNAMGVSYDKLLKFDLAEQCYRRALISKPDFAAAYNNLGYSYLMQGRPENAIDPLQKAVDLRSRNIRFHNNLALAYEQTGQIEKAAAEFRQSGQAPRTPPLPAGTHPLSAAGLADDDFPTENPEQKDHLPFFSAALENSGTDPVSDHSRDSLQQEIDMSENSPAMITRAAAEPLWVTPHIEISNGNGVYKMAGNIGTYLKYKGFDVIQVSNADHFEHSRTRIFYSDGQRQLACNLSQLFFGPDMVCDLIANGQKYGQVRILMGRDVAGLNDLFSGRLKIQVANGNGVQEIAGRLSTYLREKGFYVVRPINAGNFEYPLTQIIYPESQLANARFLAREFPMNCSGRLVKGDRHASTIHIVIGKDFVF